MDFIILQKTWNQEHHNAANRVLCYLRNTYLTALEQGGADSLEIASNASFRDNAINRKSLQGYTIKLFSGLIA